MKLFIKTDDANAMREIRKAATNKLLLGFVTNFTEPKQLKPFAIAHVPCVIPFGNGNLEAAREQMLNLRDSSGTIIPALRFNRTVVQNINWLAEEKFQPFVYSIANNVQAVFAAQAGAAFIGASTSDLLKSCLATIKEHGGGINIPYQQSWDTMVVRTCISKLDEVSDAVSQGADAAVISVELFWEILDSAGTEPMLLCETNEEKNSR